ncbi:hypothetical protein, partial [Amycolatopsis keratiniphila]
MAVPRDWMDDTRAGMDDSRDPTDDTRDWMDDSRDPPVLQVVSGENGSNQGCLGYQPASGCCRSPGSLSMKMLEVCRES